jgi:hypothetical protein
VSVRPSARISRVPTGRISVTFYTENFYDTLLGKFKFDKNQAKMSSTLHGDMGEFFFSAGDIKTP